MHFMRKFRYETLSLKLATSSNVESISTEVLRSAQAENLIKKIRSAVLPEVVFGESFSNSNLIFICDEFRFIHRFNDIRAKSVLS